MKDNYCTYKREGQFYVGVYCLNGTVFECSKKRNERGQAVKDAAEARKNKLPKKAKSESKKQPAKKPLTRIAKTGKTIKTAPTAAAA